MRSSRVSIPSPRKPSRAAVVESDPSGADQISPLSRMLSQRALTHRSTTPRPTSSSAQSLILKLVFEQVFPIHKLPPADTVIPSLMGGGDTDLLCGACRFTVAVGVSPILLAGERLTCPRCGSRNEVASSGPSRC